MIFLVSFLILITNITCSEFQVNKILAELKSLQLRVSILEKQCGNASNILNDVNYLMSQNIEMNDKIDRIREQSVDHLTDKTFYTSEKQHLFSKFSGLSSFNE